MSEKRKFRNHISVVLEQTAAVIAALAVVAVTQVFEHLDEIRRADLSFMTQKGALIAAGAAALLIGGIIAQILVWRKTYISIEDNAVVIEKGSVNKRKNTIGIRSISNINLEQNLIEMLLGTCKVKLDTNSRATADSTDVKIVLKKADALWFRQEVERRAEQAGQPAEKLCEKSDERFDVHAGPGDVVRHGIFSISVFSVAIFFLAFIGTAVSIAESIRSMTFPGAAAGGIAVECVIAASALWDTVKDFIRYYDFRARRDGDKIYIKYGFFKKVEYTIPVSKIQALKIRQTMVARLSRRYMAEIINIGIGDDKEEKNSFLILYCTGQELKRQLGLLLPEYADAPDIPAERMPASVWAAWSIPFGLMLLCTSAAAAAAVCMAPEEYIRFIWLGAAALPVLVLLCMALKYRAAGLGVKGQILKTSGGYLGRKYLCVPFRNIQYVKFCRNPAAGACGISRGTLQLLASSADTSQNIPYIREERIKEIKTGMLAR